MWEAKYGKEPFDLRLTILRMLTYRKLIAICTLAGTLLFGGIYCVKNVLLRGEAQYKAESTYRVDYAVAEEEVSGTYINGYTWNVYVHSDEFLNSVRDLLGGSGWESMSDEELEAVVTASLESDLRVPVTTVITDSPQKSETIAHAVEETLAGTFFEGISEIESVRVIDRAKAKEVIPDVRVARAFILAAVVSLFATVTVVLLRELGEDSIWLPSTIGRRYGVKVLGTVESRELAQNIKFFFEGKKTVAVCTVQEETDPVEVVKALKKAYGTVNGEEKEFLAVPAPMLCPESAEVLRRAESILLAVEAGKYAGRQLEYVLDYLAQQECKVTAVILWNADEKLLKNYYRFAESAK